MKKQLLALSIITALSACGGSGDDKTIAQAPATFSGDLTAILSKAENPALNIKVDDPNVNESLIHSGPIEGKYGTFSINVAGDWDYVLYTGEDEHPDITALVSSENADLTEIPFVIKSADGTTQTVQITLEGIDVPATFAGSVFPSINRDTGSISTSTSVRDANPAEAAFLPAIEQMGAEEVDGVVQIKTMYGVVTITVIEPVIGVEGVEAVAAADAIPEVLAVPEVPATETEPAIPAVPYQPAVPAVEAVEGVTAVEAVLGKVDWTYELDATNEAVKALEVDVIPEDKTTLPTLEDTFTLTTLDGTEQTIEITIKASEKVPAVIEGDLAVDIAPDLESFTTGAATITDVNLAQAEFQAITDVTTSYGSFSMNKAGEWRYDVDQDNSSITALTSDSTALTDTITLMALDNTPADLVITLQPPVKSLKVAEASHLGAQGKFRLDATDRLKVGKMSFRTKLTDLVQPAEYSVMANKPWDTRVALLGIIFNPDETISLQSTGTRGANEARVPVLLKNTFTQGDWITVEATWNVNDAVNDSAGTQDGTPALISLKINGEAVRSADDTTITTDIFDSLATDISQITAGVNKYNFLCGTAAADPSGSCIVDDIKVYNPEGELVVYENFETPANFINGGNLTKGGKFGSGTITNTMVIDDD
ncbi:MAG: VCBS domain-containing protein [Thalassotalea sp.]